VQAIREESGCAINIIAPAPNAPSPQQIDRIMTVKGTTDQATKAIFLIAHTIQVRAQERKKSGQDGAAADRSQARAGQPAEPQDDTTAIKLLVHRAAVGAVIGKGGEAIRATQAETGARIQVSSEPLGHSTDKTVTISGTPDVLEAAVHKVLSQLAESPLRAGTKQAHFVPGPSFYDYAADAPQQSNAPHQQQQQQHHQHAPQQQQHNAAAAAAAAASAASSTGTSALASGPISIQKIAIPTICAGCVIGRGGTYDSTHPRMR
jgi:hypothetical protein